MENSSGQGAAAIVPPEVNKWNWGAFLLTWIWGLGNKTYIALLMFVPFVNIVMIFLLGAKGSAWAWRNKKWESVEQFKAAQRKWTKAALLFYVLMIVLGVGIFFAVMAAMKSSDAYKLAVSKLGENPDATQVLGKPLSTGMPSGSVQTSGPDGSANLSFGVEGPNGKGTVYMDAVKVQGEWKINSLVLQQDGTDRRIDINQE